MHINLKYRPIRLLIFLTIFFVGYNSSYSQQSEVGFGLGGFKYTGDLARGISIKSIKPAATAFYRSNLSNAVSFRVSLTAGKLGASDSKTTIDPFARERGASFDIFLFEASTVFEYHFLKWRSEKTLIRWTPYLFGGIGIFGMSGMAEKPEEYSNIQPAIPFGVGVKYILNPKWYIGLEYGARKTFFDYLDNISGGDGVFKNYNYGNENDNDLYHYIGLSLTYSFYTIPCPNSPYSKNYRQR